MEEKKYNPMESVLQAINGKFISLSKEETKKNNDILKTIVDEVVKQMKLTNSLFKEMYQSLFFGGSFYDGLRVSAPTEFDIDLLFIVPKSVQAKLKDSNKPGYVHLEFTKYDAFLKSDLVARYKGLEKLIDNKNYLDTKKVLQWMESVVIQALNKLPKKGTESIIKVNGEPFYAKVCKGGPAFTLRVRGSSASMDIDLVPCFKLGQEEWPMNKYRKNPIKDKRDFFIVPKPLSEPKTEHYFRLSFQEQERHLMNDNKTLKPSIKLLKKMRDIQGHKLISSYYLKTVLLWELEKRDAKYWDSPLSLVFMNSLKAYRDFLKNHTIPYYWNKNNNLVGKIDSNALENIHNRVSRIIDNIDKNVSAPFEVAKFFLDQNELKTLEKYVPK